ncbi:MAG: hypothetical protein OXT67_00380 [Zetaproteobacteria bacterium]|nr:hypothetical protein [Zetaproteobacteria bacterium]
MRVADLDIQAISSSLQGYKLDFVVAGSIGAVEAVKSIRALRRLGAVVYPWLTKGGAQFVTRTALEWASGGQTVQTTFDGKHSHVGVRDGLVIAPCSANFLSSVVAGQLLDPSLALTAAYLGAGKPVMALPCMHDSLFDSPFVSVVLARAQQHISFLQSEDEEGRKKYPSCAQTFADEISHRLRASCHSPHVLVTLGGTRSSIDPVRFVGNYSSGALGSLITEELYRHGYGVHVVHGFAPRLPRCYTSKKMCSTNEAVLEECRRVLSSHSDCGLVMAAALLDYGVDQRESEKLKTADRPHLVVELSRQVKVLHKLLELKSTQAPWIACKLETGVSEVQAACLAQEYMDKYALSHFVVNDFAKISATEHEAFLFQRSADVNTMDLVQGKQKLAQEVSARMMAWYKSEAGDGSIG